MTATYNEAKDDILTVFKTAWDTTGFVALYENDPESARPDPPSTYARASLRHANGGNAGITNQVFDRDGTFFVQLFIPLANPLSEIYNLGTLITGAYQGKRTPNGVIFKDVAFREIGPSDEWYQGNVSGTFEYTEDNT